MRTPIIMAILMLATPAHAGELYRCVAAGGGVSYQAIPCKGGQRLSRTIMYVPQPDSAPMARPQTGAQRAQSKARSRPAGARRDGWPSAAQDACNVARDERRRELERLGLRRTFDDLSRIDAKVRAACKGY